MVSKGIDRSGRKWRGKRVVVGMSGGVDSSAAAALLVEQGYEVTGVYLECYQAPGCRADEDRKDAMDVAISLGIPFKVLDFKKEYREKVIDYFYREYEVGRTPNPDVMCNREIKFGIFYEWSMNSGFDYVATGHYARIHKIKNQKSKGKMAIQNAKGNNTPMGRSFAKAQDDSEYRQGIFKSASEGFVRPGLAGMEGQALRLMRGVDEKSHFAKVSRDDRSDGGIESLKSKDQWMLLRGVDDKKDQSYFLYQLREEQLPHILFPIGEMTKEEVRGKARQLGLKVAEKPDSQGICFIGEVRVDEFLKSLGMSRRIGKVFVEVKMQNSKVKMTNQNAKIKETNVARSFANAQGDRLVEVGRHEGAWFYTVGQRIGVANELKTTNNNNKQKTEQNRVYMRNLERAGLDSSNLPPLYVMEKDVEENRLVVGTREELVRDEIMVDQLHWISQGYKLQATSDKFLVRIRHGGQLVGAEIKNQKSKIKMTNQNAKRGDAQGAESFTNDQDDVGGGNLLLKLEEPVFGVAPGQAVVFYQDDVVLGGGVIQG